MIIIISLCLPSNIFASSDKNNNLAGCMVLDEYNSKMKKILEEKNPYAVDIIIGSKNKEELTITSAEINFQIPNGSILLNSESNFENEGAQINVDGKNCFFTINSMKNDGIKTEKHKRTILATFRFVAPNIENFDYRNIKVEFGRANINEVNSKESNFNLRYQVRRLVTYLDANGDGVVGILDSTIVQKKLAYMEANIPLYVENNMNKICGCETEKDFSIFVALSIQKYCVDKSFDGRIREKTIGGKTDITINDFV